jgi:hypothetical protein
MSDPPYRKDVNKNDYQDFAAILYHKGCVYRRFYGKNLGGLFFSSHSKVHKRVRGITVTRKAHVKEDLQQVELSHL